MPRVADALRRGRERLKQGPHPERAALDAESLLLQVLDRQKAWLMAHGDERLPDEAAACFARLVERRFGGEPIQYIAGEAEFYGLPFRVGPAVLIPRPETEHLVEKVLALAARFPAPRLVDVGTGSGAIPIALARYLPEAVITSIDLSPAALQVARQNAELNEVVDRIRFLEGDLLGAVAREQFEIVVSNPPYVPLTDRASLAVEVREHEPGLALFAGDDGLAAYRRLIPEAFAALVAGGYVVLEIGYGQQAAIRTLLDAGGLVEIEFHPDLQGIARVACGKKPHRG